MNIRKSFLPNYFTIIYVSEVIFFYNIYHRNIISWRTTMYCFLTPHSVKSHGYIYHGGNIYLEEIDRCYKSGLDFLFCCLSEPKTVIRLLQHSSLNCFACSSHVVNSTKNWGNILPVLGTITWFLSLSCHPQMSDDPTCFLFILLLNVNESFNQYSGQN